MSPKVLTILKFLNLISIVVGLYYVGGYLLIICFIISSLALTISVDGVEKKYELIENKTLSSIVGWMFEIISIYGFFIMFYGDTVHKTVINFNSLM